MTAEHLVFLSDDRLPSLEQWQAALTAAGVSVVLESGVNLRAREGRLRATHQGCDAAFDWFYGPLEEHFGGRLPAGVGKRTHASNFVTDGDLRSLVCAMLAAAVLAQISDGVVFDAHSGRVIGGDTALRAALEAEDHLR